MNRYDDILQAANAIRNELANRFPEHADTLRLIRFQVSAKMTRAAGMAYANLKMVKLSLPFFASEENFEHHLRSTVVHEIAHILAPSPKVYGQRREPHGPAWRAMDIKLGGNGERCHSMSLADGFSKRRTAPKVEMPCCVCGRPLKLGPRQAKEYQKGIQNGTLGPGTGYGYTHRECHKIHRFDSPFML